MKTPFGYQRVGIDFLVDGGTLLADDPGCGKTLQTIEADKRLRAIVPAPDNAEHLPAIVFCPSTVAGVWKREIEEQDPGARVLHLKGTNLKKLEQQWDWITCSTDLPGRSPKVADALRKHRFRLMAVDEAHYLKNRMAKRTQALITRPDRISKQAERLWFLTGTPQVHHVGDMWAMIATTEPDRIGRLRYPDFEDYYCLHKIRRRPGFRGKIVEERVVDKNNRKRVLEELVPALKGWMLRRRKTDVLSELPAKFRRVVPLAVSKLDPELEEFLSSKEGKALKQSMKAGRLDLVLQMEVSLSRLGRLMALSKAQAAAEYVQHVIEDEDAPGVTVWFWHTEAMDRFVQHYKGEVCRIDGSTPQGQRDGIVQRFQSPDGPKVFVGQIRAAGTGITLTKATRAVFAEIYWSPEANIQAEDRIYRIGQKFNVQIDLLSVADSIDELVAGVAEKKLAEWEAMEGALMQQQS